MNPMSEGAQSPWLEEGLRRLSWRSGEEETYSWCAPPFFSSNQRYVWRENEEPSSLPYDWRMHFRTHHGLKCSRRGSVTLAVVRKWGAMFTIPGRRARGCSPNSGREEGMFP